MYNKSKTGKEKPPLNYINETGINYVENSMVHRYEISNISSWFDTNRRKLPPRIAGGRPSLLIRVSSDTPNPKNFFIFLCTKFYKDPSNIGLWCIYTITTPLT